MCVCATICKLCAPIRVCVLSSGGCSVQSTFVAWGWHKGGVSPCWISVLPGVCVCVCVCVCACVCGWVWVGYVHTRACTHVCLCVSIPENVNPRGNTRYDPSDKKQSSVTGRQSPPAGIVSSCEWMTFIRVPDGSANHWYMKHKRGGIQVFLYQRFELNMCAGLTGPGNNPLFLPMFMFSADLTLSDCQAWVAT